MILTRYLLTEFDLRVKSCNACPLYKEATLPVPGDLVRSQVMIVGRNPGRQEDEFNRPFVGPGGRLLNEALEGANIDRAKVTVTNLAKCHTIKDRPPESEAYEACFNAHLLHEIDTLRPTYVIALGNDVFRMLAACTGSVTKSRQVFWPRRVITKPGSQSFTDKAYKPPEAHHIWVLGTLHPGSAARNGEYRQNMNDDFKWFFEHLPHEIQTEIRIA